MTRTLSGRFLPLALLANPGVASAQEVKPSADYTPAQVVEIVLRA